MCLHVILVTVATHIPGVTHSNMDELVMCSSLFQLILEGKKCYLSNLSEGFVDASALALKATK